MRILLAGCMLITPCMQAMTPNTLATTIGGFFRSISVTITPNGQLAYVGNSSLSTCLQLSNTSIIQTIPNLGDGSEVAFLAITPDGKHGYGPSFITFGNTLSVIDTDSASPNFNSVIATVTGFLKTNIAMDITPDGTRGYSVIENFGIYLVDTNPLSPNYNTATQIINTLITRDNNFIKITPNGNFAYA